MNAAIWEHVRRAAEICAAARKAQGHETKGNLRRAAHDLLRSPILASAPKEPSWGEVLMAHSLRH